MPAKSEAQRRLFAMCATHGGRHPKANCPNMPTSKMHEFMHKVPGAPYKVKKK